MKVLHHALVAVALSLLVDISIAQGTCDDALDDCTNEGYWEKKQCDNDKCWCVKKLTGDPAFGGQEVPLYDSYNCKRRPRKCIKARLDAMLANPLANVKECDRKGFFQKKQCGIVTGPQCTDPSDMCTPTEPVGFAPIDRPKLDTKPKWTMVQTQKFGSAGQIIGFEAWVGASGNPLQIGVYSPDGAECEFKLKQQVEWTPKALGYQKVMLDEADWLDVAANDSVGFTWTNGAVLDYATVVEYNYCDIEDEYDEGEAANLIRNANGNREYSIRFFFQTYVGNAPVSRAKLDTAKLWTMVSREKFPTGGIVNTIELYARRAGNLDVGLYRPVDATDCEFTLIKQITLKGLIQGLNTVYLSGDDVFLVRKDDQIGFTWKRNGVVEYGDTADFEYCDKEAKFEEGNTAVLELLNGKREYSFRVLFKPCTGPLCDECYCVRRKKGTERGGTRTTTGIDDLTCP